MKLVDLSVRQPITVAVGVLLSVLAGLVAFREVPIQMTPTVDSVVVAATTYWENASAAEIESDVIEEQEQRLGDLAGLLSMTSISRAGSGSIRLEFMVGTDIDDAMAEVDQKLSEVPGYPVGVDEPEIEDVDPDSVDYIAWIALSPSDPAFDASTLHDFMERRLRPRLERIPGVSQVGMVGTREREVHIVVDPEALARRGMTYAELLQAIDLSNDNYSGGKLTEGKADVRIRTVGRFLDVDSVEDLVVRRTPAGPVYLRDVAEVREEFKELRNWARARGHLVPFFNFQLALGANLLETMERIQAELAALNRDGGLLDQEAARLGLDGTLRLVQTYDATTYVNDALGLVQSNILVGGILATLTLLLFLRSLRTVGIIGVAIPISVVASIVVLVALGRTMNIVSLAGMAFAVGMVVDNAIVVIENIHRHLDLGKGVRAAARDGAAEVAGAVVASTLTTLVVFTPILLIQDAAGQLFRDIALAIMAAVGVSLLVSLTVIPAAARTILRPAKGRATVRSTPPSFLRRVGGVVLSPFTVWRRVPGAVGGFVRWLSGGVVRTVLTIAVFTAGTIWGIAALLPPLDYLPSGNRNIVFGILIPPPSYSLGQLEELGGRMEAMMRPHWEAAGDRFAVEEKVRGGPPDRDAPRDPVPLRTGGEVTPPPIDHYFMVAREGQLFHGAISDDKDRVIDVIPLMNAAAAGA
ncbi:MAG: efflux RND transporter permease subunit, partial [Planctomycetota bacterium JB042]